jgi:hypothetical protein
MTAPVETASMGQNPHELPASPLRREVTPDGLLITIKALAKQGLELNPIKLRFSGTPYVLRVFRPSSHEHITHDEYVQVHDLHTMVTPGKILVELPAETDLNLFRADVQRLNIAAHRRQQATRVSGLNLPRV